MTFDEWFLNNVGPINERKIGSFNLMKRCWDSAIASTKQPEKQIPALFKPLVNPDEGY